MFIVHNIEKIIKYEFNNKTLLEQAFTRSSYAKEHIEATDNETLEFIGDSILGVLVVKKLIAHYQIGVATDIAEKCVPFLTKERFECELDEAELSALKIEIVQRASLAKATERLGLEKYLLMGRSDILGNVHNQDSVKEDLLEAIIGAVAVDSGWNMNVLEKLVNKLIDFDVLLENGGTYEEDYECILKEWFEQKGRTLKFEKEISICKNLKFGISVCLGMDMLNQKVYGYGATERGARIMAAKRAVKLIGQTNNRSAAIINAVGEPNLERAVNQLQELHQKKLIPEPKYTFKKCGVTQSGNPGWECSCTIEGLVDDSGGYVCTSKGEAKKYQAFETLNYLIGKDLKTLFLDQGKEVNVKKTTDKEIYNERN